MYVIGLTGGVGSGKTVAAHKLAQIAGAELLIADELGHLVMKKGEKGCQSIVQAFGTGILDEQGEIDRSSLSKLVFHDRKALERLNQIVHPAVFAYLKEYLAARKEQKGYVILETAIMFETGCDALCDEIWYIYVPSAVRRERLAQNRGYSEEKSNAIMQKQLSKEEFAQRCSQIIRNDGSIEELEEKLKESFRMIVF
jgi:dephospho-CoA kinase